MTAEGYVGILLLLQLVLSARFGHLQQAVMWCTCLHVRAQYNTKVLVSSSLALYMLLSGCGSLHQSLYRAHAHARGYQHPRVQSLNPTAGVHYIQ